MVHVTNTHKISIEVENSRKKEVFQELCVWGEATWWPQRSLMRFINFSGPGQVKEGTVYRQKVRLPFGPAWHARIDRIVENESVTRIFLDGLFRGYEKVSLKETGTRSMEVSYYMDVFIKGRDYIVWKMIFQRLHDQMLEKILGMFKAYVEGRHTHGCASCGCAH